MSDRAPKQSSFSERTFSLRSRRTTRVAIRIPTEIRVRKDAIERRVQVHTLLVNRHGARLEAERNLDLGQEIIVTALSTQRTATARVVWVDPRPNRGGNYEFAVELLDATNLWGVGFPPGDPQDEVRGVALRADPDLASA